MEDPLPRYTRASAGKNRRTINPSMPIRKAITTTAQFSYHGDVMDLGQPILIVSNTIQSAAQ